MATGEIVVTMDADLQNASEGCEPTDEPADGADEGEGDVPADDGAGADDDADDDGAEGTPSDDVPADDSGDDAPGGAGDACESFMDCASPLQCIEGSCIYLEG